MKLNLKVPIRSLAWCACVGASLLGVGQISLVQAAPNTRISHAPVPVLPASAPKSHVLSYVVVVVNTEPITWGELQARANALQQQETMKPQPQTRSAAQWQSAALEELIEEKAVEQWARDRGIEIEESVLNGAIEEAAARMHLSLQAWEARLKAAGVSMASYRQEWRRHLLWDRLREKEIDPGIQVENTDIDAFLARQPGLQVFGQPQIEWGHVLFALPDHPSPEQIQAQEAAAQALVSAVRSSRGGLRQLSMTPAYARPDPQERYRVISGGRVDEYPRLFAADLMTAPLGQVRGPVRSPAGFHVFEVLQRQAAPIPLLQTHVRHILLTSVNPQGLPEQAKRLAQMRQKVLRRQDVFEDLAKKYSEDDSAQTGGDLGWALPGQFVPAFEQAMNRLEPGQISPPVLSEFGVHLIEVLERKPAAMPIKAQRQWVKQALTHSQAQAAFERWRQDVRRNASVVYPQGSD
jgi:peptidyl-prolyl cis-trans isomerase SurA